MHAKTSLNVDDLSVLAGSTEAESDAAHRMNERVGAPAVDLPSQASHIDIDDVRHRIEMQVPDVLQQQPSGDDLPGIANQIFEQPELFRQQLELSTVAVCGAGEKIDLKVADPQYSR